MKKIIITLALMFAYNANAQLIGEKFTTKWKNISTNEFVNIEFEIDSATQSKITTIPVYLNWAKLIEEPTLEKFLEEQCKYAQMHTLLNLSTVLNYSPYSNHIFNQIFIVGDDTFLIKYVFKGQNKYGLLTDMTSSVFINLQNKKIYYNPVIR